MKEGRITSYFKTAEKRFVSFSNPKISKNHKTKCEKTAIDQISKTNNSKCLVLSDSEDDCVIVEKEIPIVDLEVEVVSERDGIASKEDDIVSPNSVPCSSQVNDALSAKDLDSSNDFDAIMCSQESEIIPADDLDGSFLSLGDEVEIVSTEIREKRVIQINQNMNCSKGGTTMNEEIESITTVKCQKTNEKQKGTMEDKKQFNVNSSTSSVSCQSSNTSGVGKKTRKRVVIKRDYVTTFMVQMVKRFMASKELYHLFKEEDFNIIKSFHNLKSIGAQILFARMYWLKPCYKSTSHMVQKYLKVNFKCKAVRDMIKSLKAAKLLDNTILDIKTWCEFQTRPDLVHHVKPFMKKFKFGSLMKHEIVDAVVTACNPKNDISKHFIQRGKRQETPLKQHIDKLIQMDDFIQVDSRGRDVFQRLHLLMYTGMNPQILRDKKLNLLLLNVKRNLQHYPAMDIKCDSLAGVFPSREYFEAYVEATYALDSIVSCIADKMEVDTLRSGSLVLKYCQNKFMAEYDPPVWLHRFSPFSICYKAIELCVPRMRKNSIDCDLAAYAVECILPETKFRVHKKPLWYTELVTCYWKKSDHKEAAKYLEMALTEPTFSPDDKIPLCDKAQRLATMKSAKLDNATRTKLLELSHQVYPDIPHIKVCGTMIGSNIGRNPRMKYKVYDKATGSTVYSNVEDFAIHHYTTKLGYTRGEHWESSIITSIFVLAFWDIIYCEMPGKAIFVCPYQELPLDMYTSAFYTNRKDIIDQRLNVIKQSEVSDIISIMKGAYDARKPGDFSLYKDNISWDDICDIVKCLGSTGMYAVCKRLAHSYYKTHSGFPDLTVWDPAANKIKFVEVKSFNDRLSFKQIRWMQYMVENGVDTEVCFITRNQTDIDVIGRINKQSSSNLEEAMLMKKLKDSKDTHKRLQNMEELIKFTAKYEEQKSFESRGRKKNPIKEFVKCVNEFRKYKKTQERHTDDEESMDSEELQENEEESTGGEEEEEEGSNGEEEDGFMGEEEECMEEETTEEEEGSSDFEIFSSGNSESMSEEDESKVDVELLRNVFKQESKKTETVKLVETLQVLKETAVSKSTVKMEASEKKNVEKPCNSKAGTRQVTDDSKLSTSVATNSSKLKGTASNNKSPKKSPLKNDSLPGTSSNATSNNIVSPSDGVYLRSPTKYSKGVGYYVSPSKNQQTSPSPGQSRSPYKNLSPKRKVSLSLTRRRLTDFDK